jgi:hypothetical protein
MGSVYFCDVEYISKTCVSNRKFKILTSYTMIEVIFKIFLTDYIDFQGFITKRIQKPLLIEYKIRWKT